MDWVNVKSKAGSWFKKYRYVVLIVAIGLVLISLPTKSKQVTSETVTTESVYISDAADDEKRLEQILSRITGVGEVNVMLTLACSQQTIYQTDTDSSDSGNTQRKDTVTVTDRERANTGLITRIDAPKYLGAVIVCKGGNDPGVQLAIVDAVSKALGLNSNEISVLKMK